MPRMKRWETPRREGRNTKSRGGSARVRQLKKRRKQLVKKLRNNRQRKFQNL